MGKLRTEFTCPIVKSTSPGLLSMTFFAHWSRLYTLMVVSLSGVESETSIPGKIEAYLSQHCRSHYEQLVGNGCFINGEASNKSG